MGIILVIPCTDQQHWQSIFFGAIMRSAVNLHICWLPITSSLLSSFIVGRMLHCEQHWFQTEAHTLCIISSIKALSSAVHSGHCSPPPPLGPLSFWAAQTAASVPPACQSSLSLSLLHWTVPVQCTVSQLCFYIIVALFWSFAISSSTSFSPAPPSPHDCPLYTSMRLSCWSVERSALLLLHSTGTTATLCLVLPTTETCSQHFFAHTHNSTDHFVPRRQTLQTNHTFLHFCQQNWNFVLFCLRHQKKVFIVYFVSDHKNI